MRLVNCLTRRSPAPMISRSWRNSYTTPRKCMRFGWGVRYARQLISSSRFRSCQTEQDLKSLLTAYEYSSGVTGIDNNVVCAGFVEAILRQTEHVVSVNKIDLSLDTKFRVIMFSSTKCGVVAENPAGGGVIRDLMNGIKSNPEEVEMFILKLVFWNRWVIGPDFSRWNKNRSFNRFRLLLETQSQVVNQAITNFETDAGSLNVLTQEVTRFIAPVHWLGSVQHFVWVSPTWWFRDEPCSRLHSLQICQIYLGDYCIYHWIFREFRRKSDPSWSSIFHGNLGER